MVSGTFHHVAIIGPGLLGGSLALALRHFSPQVELTIWGRSPRSLQPLESCLALAGCGLCLDVREAVAGADLVVLATPIGAMPELARQFLPVVKPGAVVTDVGSVKGCVHEALDPLFVAAGREFTGSHPMAGAEVQGFQAARFDLFNNAPVALTRGPASSVSGVERLKTFWEGVGGRPMEFAPLDHDDAVARVSHLTHCMASLTALCATNGHDMGAQLAGPGYRDTSRVAAGDPGMWQEILHENRAAVIPALCAARDHLDNLITFLETGDAAATQDWLAVAREHRLAIQQRWNAKVFTEDDAG